MPGNVNSKIVSSSNEKNVDNSIVLLVDMDCFYCQVEEKHDVSLTGKPIAVVQHNDWQGGGIIAVNYAAREKGVTRYMRGDEAKQHCPEIQLVKVPNVNEKADLSKYRKAGKEVIKVLHQFTKQLERASVDEAYLDITESVEKRLNDINNGQFVLEPVLLFNTFVVGYGSIGEFISTISSAISNVETKSIESNIKRDLQEDLRLLVGASIANEMRQRIKLDTGYECSAGIANNKVTAKLACGINKPNKQTILPMSKISTLFSTLPVRKIPGLGGKFGKEIVDCLNIKYIGDLTRYTEMELIKHFEEKNGIWLYNICRGIDFEPVTTRVSSKSIGCCKKFPGRNAIAGLNQLNHWLNKLTQEITDRLEEDTIEHNRKAKQITLSFVQSMGNEEVSNSRSAPLTCYDSESMTSQCLEILKSNTKQFLRSNNNSALNNPIYFLGVSVGKFETITKSKMLMQRFLKTHHPNKSDNTNSTVAPTTKTTVGVRGDSGFYTAESAQYCSEYQPKDRQLDFESQEFQEGPKCEAAATITLSNADYENRDKRFDSCEYAKFESDQQSESAKRIKLLTSTYDDSKLSNDKSFFSKFLKTDEKCLPNDFCNNNEIQFEASHQTTSASSEADPTCILKFIEKEEQEVKPNPARNDSVNASSLLQKTYTSPNKRDSPSPIDCKPSTSHVYSNAIINKNGPDVQSRSDVCALQGSLNENFKNKNLCDYSEFAECQVPAAIIYSESKTSHICCDQIFKDEFLWQIHTDKHYAEELQEQEKKRFKPTSIKPAALTQQANISGKEKRNTKNKNQLNSIKKNLSIKQFFSQAIACDSQEQLQPDGGTGENNGTNTKPKCSLKCKYCDLNLQTIEKLEEHEDYHLAAILQNAN